MLRSTLVALLLLFSAAASAEDFDYTYLWLGYGSLDLDNVNADGNGYMLGGSYAVADKIHVFAGYDSAEVDGNVDVSRLSAGVGYNTTISDALDMFARLSYESVEVDILQAHQRFQSRRNKFVRRNYREIAYTGLRCRKDGRGDGGPHLSHKGTISRY